jgi:uncharacterized protein YndB with AHSA1/START domain
MVAGFVAVMVVQGMSSWLYPMPADVDPNDLLALKAWIKTLPLGAYLMVLLSWGCGAWTGTYVARRLTPLRRAVPALLVWGLFLIATIANLVMLPHPAWFWLAGIGSGLAFGLIGLVHASPSSYRVHATRTIRAPIERVFQTLARAEEFSKVVPGITRVEFLSEQHYGVGTRIRETRMMNGREAIGDLEVTELVENQRIRLVTTAGGAEWDTVFSVTPSEASTVLLDMEMEARPQGWFSKFVTPLVLGMVDAGVQRDMDAVKTTCEST